MCYCRLSLFSCVLRRPQQLSRHLRVAPVRRQRQQDQRSATGLGSRYLVLQSWVGVACETYGGQYICFVGCVGCVNPCHNRVAGLYRPISDSSRSAMPASRVYILPIRAGDSRSTGGHGSGALPCSVGGEPPRADCSDSVCRGALCWILSFECSIFSFFAWAHARVTSWSSAESRLRPDRISVPVEFPFQSNRLGPRSNQHSEPTRAVRRSHPSAGCL